MMQLLQARGWYGIFLTSEAMEPEIERAEDAEGLRKRARLHVRLRPLIGWCSAEGGFQGLYYDETRGSLSTRTKIEERNGPSYPDRHLGDLCQDETTTVRALLIENVIETGVRVLAEWQLDHDITLTETAKRLLVHKMVPIPKLPNEE